MENVIYILNWYVIATGPAVLLTVLILLIKFGQRTKMK